MSKPDQPKPIEPEAIQPEASGEPVPADPKAKRDAAEREIERLKREVSQTKEQYLRAAAEFDNTKKRLQREKDEHAKYAAETVIRDLLPILDALRSGDARGCRCAFFASPRFSSDVGQGVAQAIGDELATVLPHRAEVCGRAYAVLRETRMPAVVCELVSEDDVDGMRDLVGHAGDAGRAIVRGVRRAVEVPVDSTNTRSEDP